MIKTKIIQITRAIRKTQKMKTVKKIQYMMILKQIKTLQNKIKVMKTIKHKMLSKMRIKGLNKRKTKIIKAKRKGLN